MVRRIAVSIIGILFALIAFTGCASDSQTVSDNLSTQAEQFRIERDIVFYNGITDKYIAEVQGRCSVDSADGVPAGTLAVTCKTGPDTYIKDYLGKAQNVVWFSLQVEDANVSPYHHEIILKPSSVLPEFTGSDSAAQ